MVVFSSFLALVSGLATLIALSLVLELSLRRFVPAYSDVAPHHTRLSALVRIVATLVPAAAGGYFTAFLTGRDSIASLMRHALILAVIVLALAALSLLQTRGERPLPLRIAELVLAPVGVLLGALLRLHQLGVF